MFFQAGMGNEFTEGDGLKYVVRVGYHQVKDGQRGRALVLQPFKVLCTRAICVCLKW
jgi:hypothetical protein